MKKQKKIRDILLLSHSTNSVAIASILLIWIAITQVHVLRDSLNANMNQLSNSIVYGVSSEIDRMNTSSLSILYSNLAKSSFENYIKSTENNSINQYNNYKNLGDLLNTINIQNSSMSEIILYDLEVGSFTFGVNSNVKDRNAKDQSWYQQALLNKGEKLITLPFTDPDLTAKTTYKKNSQYLSLVRLFFYNYNTPQGFVEIKQNLDTIFSIFETILPYSSYDFVVLNSDGIPLYPIDKQNIDFSTYYNAYQNNASSDLVGIKNPQNGEKEIVKFQKIDNCDFINLIIVNKQKLYQPVYSFIIKFILISLIVLLGVLWISYYLSNRITRPIYAIYNNVKNIDINQQDFMPHSFQDTNILEINALWVALRVSHTQLQDSMNKLILSEQQDMQSKMLALQSQMNPHFLHNTLAALSTMIEEGEVEASIQLCQSMSSILRYISSSKDQLVTLEEDLENTTTYIDCMKSRYLDDLTYSFDIPDNILDIKIPKLFTQLLVENSIKYATLKSAPWHIHIRGYRDEKHWYISVIDNGFGFDAQVLQSLNDKIAAINSTNLLPNLELNGMGLMNIFIRLKLQYNVTPIFHVHNLENGGCEVTIGGLIDE